MSTVKNIGAGIVGAGLGFGLVKGGKYLYNKYYRKSALEDEIPTEDPPTTQVEPTQQQTTQTQTQTQTQTPQGPIIVDQNGNGEIDPEDVILTNLIQTDGIIDYDQLKPLRV